MLLLVSGAWLGANSSGFLGRVALELRDEEGSWAFFQGVVGGFGLVSSFGFCCFRVASGDFRLVSDGFRWVHVGSKDGDLHL